MLFTIFNIIHVPFLLSLFPALNQEVIIGATGKGATGKKVFDSLRYQSPENKTTVFKYTKLLCTVFKVENTFL